MSKHDQVQFRLPDVLAGWPWPRVINPYYDEVRIECDRWVHSLHALGPESQEAFHRWDLCRLAALSYPRLDKERFRTACDLIVLLYFFDEYTDRYCADQVRQHADIVMDALAHPHKPRPDGECFLGEVARQFWERGTRVVSAVSQAHCVDAFRRYTEAVVVEATDRDISRVRNIEEYLRLRRYTVAVELCFVPVEFAMDLPDEVILHPTVVKLSKLVIDVIIFDNDLFSYNREQASDDAIHNIVTVAMSELNVDLTGAIAWMEEQRIHLTEEIIRTWDALPDWREDIRKDATDYVLGVVGWVRSNYAWSFESQRYFGKQSLEIQQHKTVTLMPKKRGWDRRIGDGNRLANLMEVV
ncbi:terpenoid synthase [Artomyces pyxidatus]|uniref:Terpenoid synthase n=1 Tax=Artomyces pyxidatus TaxID=48021 RepID=A0ACB8SVP3_9AGAM|nr:terpenoid synthase [Artomyces pyxidatus]